MTNKSGDILEAAIELFYTNGCSPSAADVAEKAECSKKQVFSYYDNMDNLYKECYNLICSRIMRSLTEIKFPEKVTGESVFGYIDEVCERYFMHLSTHPADASFYSKYCMTLGPLPKGYDNPDDVVKRVLGEHYTEIKSAFPHIDAFMKYLVTAAGPLAIAVSKGWFDEFDNPPKAVAMLMINGSSAFMPSKDDVPVRL